MAGYLIKPRIARWWRLTDTSLFVEGAMHTAQAFLRKDTGVTSNSRCMCSSMLQTLYGIKSGLKRSSSWCTFRDAGADRPVR